MTGKSWFLGVILDTVKGKHRTRCYAPEEKTRSSRNASLGVYEAQQCWLVANNVNHDVERACRTQPLETRERLASSNPNHTYFSRLSSAFIPAQNPSTSCVLPNELSDSYIGCLVSRRIKYGSDSPSSLLVIYRDATRRERFSRPDWNIVGMERWKWRVWNQRCCKAFRD